MAPGGASRDAPPILGPDAAHLVARQLRLICAAASSALMLLLAMLTAHAAWSRTFVSRLLPWPVRFRPTGPAERSL